MKPTIVLVHGAFAASSSWNSIIPPLADDQADDVVAELLAFLGEP